MATKKKTKKKCVRCDQPIARPVLSADEGEICAGCVDDGTQFDDDDPEDPYTSEGQR